MDREKRYDAPSNVSAEKGEVVVDGPDREPRRWHRHWRRHKIAAL